MEPTVRVEQQAAERGSQPELWRIEWNIENVGDRPLTILAARCPHGKFRCEEKVLTPALDVESNEACRVELDVRCGEPAGSVIENAFLILRIAWDGRPWLILARLRVLVKDKSLPRAVTELVTAQPVGFSREKTEG